MEESANPIEPHLQRLVDFNVTGLDIMHGQLKLDMLQAEAEYTRCLEIEEESGDAMDGFERKYMEGYLDALTYLYKTTYDLSFAISDKESKNGNA